jgi:CHAT domain-containing protein/tetratricopeptide (TPR) repeat protein
MKRISILFILALLCWLPFGFAQTPTAVAENQDPLKDSLAKYEKLKLYSKYVPFARQWAEQIKKEKGENNSEYGNALNDLGNSLYRCGKFSEAEPVLLKGLDIYKNTIGEVHKLAANTMNNLGNVYSDMGNYKMAETYYLQGLDVRRKLFGEDNILVASSLNNLGILYKDLSNYSMAETYLMQSLEIRKKNLGENHLDVAGSLNGLGNLNKLMGNYPKAESSYLKSLEIRKKNLGDNHPDVAKSLLNLGNLYILMGNYSKTENCYLQAIDINTKNRGENNSDGAVYLINLGNLYLKTRNFAKAESCYLQALEIRKKIFGEKNYNVATPLNDLGLLHKDINNFYKAESYHLQALEIYKQALGGENFDHIVISLYNLGLLNRLKGNYLKAEEYYIQALKISNKIRAENHPDVAEYIISYGILDYGRGEMDKAEIHFRDWCSKKHFQIQRYFPFLSDNEKEQFYNSNILDNQEYFKSFCLQHYGRKKDIAGDLFNDQLASKGLLLNSSAKWKHRIKTAGDKKLNRLFDEWETNQNKLTKLFQSTDSTERAGMDSLQAKTEKMEKELSLRSENFAKLADKKLINWKDVQKALKPGEAAVEMVRVKKFGIEKTVTDTSDPKKPVYKVKGLTDTIYYAALIIKPESLIPEMVLLKNGNDLEGKHLNYYQNSISKQIQDNQSYGKFWEKIGTKLGTSSRVNFSPDGVYHNINLNTLFNPKTKKFLLEEKDIRLVTVTKDIVNPGPAEEDNKLAELVGFPSYYQNATAQATTATERKSPEMSYGLRLESMGTLAELPGTKTEVDNIAGILSEKGWEVKNYTGSTALEENIKESYKPRLLHVATHGFFQPDTTKGSNPLLRSGLMLTGAGNTLKGEKNETGEDGILTAYEAMNLNLDNTDLVVLSACETGLGEIKNGEGVYGLQRAFKVAGAKSIIMSLWKVDDDATQELMVSFYRNWLGSASYGSKPSARMNKRSAFLKAQKELKAKYPNPYFWGAFVMVGE